VIRERVGGVPRRSALTHCGAALALGVLHAASFGPLAGWWLQLLALAGLIVILYGVKQPPSASRHFLSVLCFGLGSFVAGIGWMYVSMHRFGGMPAPMAAAAVVLLSLYLGAFGALAATLARRLGGAGAATGAGDGQWRPGFGPALIFAGCWTLGELARGYLLTGFPWLSIGYAHLGGVLHHIAPTLGVYGVGTFAALVAFGLALVAISLHQRRSPLVGLALVVLPAVLALSLSGISWVQPRGPELSVRLLQGNIAQDLKFDPARTRAAMATYVDMVEAGTAELTILPETAWTVPWRITPPDFAARLTRYAAAGNALVIGMPLETGAAGAADQGRNVANSVALIGANGRVDYRYDKRHLVPFGEFVPALFGWFVRMMEIPLGDFARGSATQPALQFGGQSIAFNICFEDLFGEELALQVRAGATVLINVSNLAWFGDSHALDQHLSIARMRALELGRPMLRSTNTGVTAVIDREGSVVAQLPTGVRGTLESTVRGAGGLTPYARYGNLPALVMALCLVAAGAGLCSRARRRTR